MNEGTAQAVVTLITISEQAIAAALEIKKQNELQDEQLLAYAESKGGAVRDQAQRFLDATK